MADYKIVILNGSKQTQMRFREPTDERAADRFKWLTKPYRTPGVLIWFFKDGKLHSKEAQRFNDLGD